MRHLNPRSCVPIFPRVFISLNPWPLTGNPRLTPPSSLILHRSELSLNSRWIHRGSPAPGYDRSIPINSAFRSSSPGFGEQKENTEHLLHYEEPPIDRSRPDPPVTNDLADRPGLDHTSLTQPVISGFNRAPIRPALGNV